MRTSTPHTQLGKLPPQALEMESAVIGACILEPDAFRLAHGIIHDYECFYMEVHQVLFKSMMELYKNQTPIDLLTVTNELRRIGKLDEIGGSYALMKLTMEVTSSAHIEAHARVVVEKYLCRELIRVSQTASTMAYDESNDIFDLLETIKFQIESITKDLNSGEDLPVGRIFSNVTKQLAIQSQTRSPLTGVDTGLFELNEITNGWQNSDLIIIGARPSKGKTALALNLAYNAAISQLVNGVPVGIFSLEMGSDQLVKRMIATVSGIDFGKIISGNLTEQELFTISSYSRHFNSLPIHIADKIFTMQGITAKARKWKEKHEVGLIAIDYLQLIKAIRQSGSNREQEVSSISRDLKLLAKELNVPIILLSQLNRGVESRGSAEPQPADLRESGAIEQDADVIIFPWHTEEESFVSVAKNRNGKTAVKDYALKIKFAGNIQKWMSPNEFERSKQSYIPDNARAGINNHYQAANTPRWEDADEPFS